MLLVHTWKSKDVYTFKLIVWRWCFAINYGGYSVLKRFCDFLSRLPMTIVAGAFLLLDLIPHLTGKSLNLLPFDPAWVTVFISGIPLLYLALWRVVRNKGISKIAPELTLGAGVVTTRSHVHWFVTEFGAVNLYGKSLQERARLIISVAHPDHREALDRAAFERYGSHHHYIKATTGF